MMHRLTVLALPLLMALAACSTQKSNPPSPTRPEAQGDVGSIVNQPLSDLNISSDEIPPLLIQALKDPYATPPDPDCPSLQADITALSMVLGPDLQAAKPGGEKEGLLSEDRAGEAAWSAARSAAVGWIPFRGVIRFVTGAERHEQEVRGAVLAGFVRRAYLKGLRRSLDCPPPAKSSIKQITPKEQK